MDAVEVFAQSQFGLLTRVQARERGVSDSGISRRVQSGRWATVHPGVFRVVGAPRSEHQQALAAVLWTSGALSHASAGRLLHFEHMAGADLHVTVEYQRSYRSDAFTLHRTMALPDIDRKFVDGICCTSATRTMIDCAPDLDDESFEAAFEAGRRMGLTTRTLMQRRATELCGRGRSGSDRVKRILAISEGRALESRLEVKTARLLRTVALPPPMRQYALAQYRLDFAWPWLRLAIECDGFERHGNRLAWKRDRRRIAAIEALGWRIVHLTWEDVTRRPGETVDRIGLAIAAAA
jgi:very-short-patch-repair endonuclease